MAVSFKGVHFPKEIILTEVRWYVAYVRRESGMDKCDNTIGYTGTR
jgi:transposase-like protein